MTRPVALMAAEELHDGYPHITAAGDTVCPCGTTTRVYDGLLGLHTPKTELTPDGQQRPLISDAYGSSGCRSSLRTITLDAAIQRDNLLNPVEQHIRNVTRHQLEQGMAFAVPRGSTLPKAAAKLLALAEANGWATAQVWEPTDYGYVLCIRVGRAHNWKYDRYWFTAVHAAEQAQYGRSYTPDSPHRHSGPSLAVVRKAISKNPLLVNGEPPYLGPPGIWSWELGVREK